MSPAALGQPLSVVASQEQSANNPTVCLDGISMVARSCRYDSGQIEPLVAHT